MKSIILKQLKKCKNVDLQHLTGEEMVLHIPKCQQISIDTLELDHTYIIKVDQYVLNSNETNSVIVTNWNRGQIITSEYLKVSLGKVMNNMYMFDGVGYDNITDSNKSDFYSSVWIPQEHFSVIKEISQ